MKLKKTLYILGLIAALAGCNPQQLSHNDYAEPSTSKYRAMSESDIASMDGELTSNPINGSDELDCLPGTYFVYCTNQGRYGKFIVEALDKSANNKLTIAWVTYRSDGRVYSSGSKLVIRGTWTCDLDAGVEGAATKDIDFHWEQLTSLVRQLSPWNGARFKMIFRA